MRVVNTKWGSRLEFENGAYIGFAWKVFLLVFGSLLVIIMLFAK